MKVRQNAPYALSLMQKKHCWRGILPSGDASLVWAISTTDLVCRDLGTEGAEDADVSLRKCISSSPNGAGIIPGPRYHCASRAIVTTGSYGPKNNSRPYVTEVDGKQGADSASGK